MVSSTLNPQAITGNNAATPSSFGDFMTGGRASSSSGIVGAANKIVGFNRPNVTPATPNLNNVVSNISTNVLSSVGSSVSNLGSLLQNQFNQALQRFTQDYQKRIKGFDDNRPGNVLTKFLDLYKNAIGFINFFANTRNIRTIESSLKTLRKIFQESFEVATVIRQTIVKIVKQLSNLPTASPRSGGLDLNIAVPGGKLKQAGGPAVRNVGRGRGGAMLAGAGLLAVGGAGMAISGGMNKAKEYQESMLAQGVKPDEETQNIPENIVESFSAIVDRFISAVNSLIGGAKKSSGSGSGGGGASPGPPPPPPGPPGGGGVTIKDDAQALQELGFTQEQFNALKQGVADVEGAKYNEMGGAGTRFAGRYQMGSAEISASAKVMGIPVPSREEYLNNPELQEKIYMGRTIYMHRKLQTLSPKYNTMSPKERAIALGMGQLGEGNVSSYINTGIITRDSANVPITKWGTAVGKRFDEVSSNPLKSQAQVTAASQQPQSQVAAAPAQTQASQARAQTISQPAQQPIQTVSLPPTVIDAGGGQSQGGGGGAAAQPIPAPSSGSYEVPMLPTTNPDNFLTMYSRIVYNIVDG